MDEKDEKEIKISNDKMDMRAINSEAFLYDGK